MTKAEVIELLKKLVDWSDNFNGKKSHEKSYGNAIREAVHLLETPEKVCEWTEHREQHRDADFIVHYFKQYCVNRRERFQTNHPTYCDDCGGRIVVK